MTLLIKQHVFSWSDTYDVYDETKTPKYYVKAEFFSLTHRIHIYRHSDGVEIGEIDEKFISMYGKADITIFGNRLGSITRKLSFFKPKYAIDYNGWQIEGDFFGWDYSIRNRSGNEVAVIIKKLLSWGDTYTLEVANPDDELAALITVIAIDMMNCDGN